MSYLFACSNSRILKKVCYLRQVLRQFFPFNIVLNNNVCLSICIVNYS